MIDAQANEPAENVTPSGPDKVLSDADMGLLVKPQEKEDVKSEEANDDTVEKQEKETDSETENTTKAKSAKSSILNVFKRKKKEPEKPQEDSAETTPEGKT
jgi:hypothetical protein